MNQIDINRNQKRRLILRKISQYNGKRIFPVIWLHNITEWIEKRKNNFISCQNFSISI